MLHFIVNNFILILDPKTKIRYELNSSYFDEEGIPSGKVWHFDVPAAENEHVFDYSNYIVVAKKYRVYDCVIRLHAYPIGRGKLVVSTAGAKKFRISVTLNSFALDFENVTLKDAPYEAENIGGKNHSQAAVLQHAKEVNAGTLERDYRFPMAYAPNFYGELTDHDNDTNTPEVIAYNPTYAGYLNNWSAGAFLENNETDGNRNSLVPFPLLGRSLAKCLSLHNYQLQGAFTEDSELANLLLFGNSSIDGFGQSHYVRAKLGTAMTFDQTPRKLFFSSVEQDHEDLWFEGNYNVTEPGKYRFLFRFIIDINWENTNYVLFLLNMEFKFNGQHFAYWYCNGPTTYRNGVALNGLYSFRVFPGIVECAVEFDFATAGNVEMYFYNQTPVNGRALLGNSMLEVKKSGVGDMNEYSGFLNLSNHLSATPITEVVNSLRNTFFLAPFFDEENRILAFETLRDVLVNKYSVDLSNHLVHHSGEITPQEPVKIKLGWSDDVPVCDVADSNLAIDYAKFADLPAVMSRKTYAVLTASQMVFLYDKYKDDQAPEWRFYAHNYKPLVEDENAAWDVQSIFSPMAVMDNGKFYPYFAGQGNSDAIPETTDDIGLQLLFWRGVTADRPVALPGNQDENGQLGERTLSVKDASGLMHYGSSWLDFIRNKEEFKTRLTNIDLFKLIEIQDLFLPKRRDDHPRWVHQQGVKALPKQFTAIMNVNGDILDSEIILVKKAES